jgi:sphingomyelin phosphodiesterase
MLIFQFDAGNPLDQPLPLNSDFWEKKSQYYSHGTSSDEDVRLAEEVVAHRLQLKHDDKSRRLEAQLELIAPVVDKAERKWAELVDDVDHLNFTAIEWEIENELPEPNDRTWRKGRERGRGARGLPAFLGNAVKLFDLKQVVKELETSVMTSVSCSACKAGTTTTISNGIII